MLLTSNNLWDVGKDKLKPFTTAYRPSFIKENKINFYFSAFVLRSIKKRISSCSAAFEQIAVETCYVYICSMQLLNPNVTKIAYLYSLNAIWKEMT